MLNIDTEIFLANHWQRTPALLRSAIPDFQPPISADELAGLAMEAEVEARIIELEDPSYRLSHGPFEAGDFNRTLPWTLLVQAVDLWVPEVAALRELVRFLPSWRFDDIMVSYASHGGGVGPHFDNYDVFLLQGEGCRRWRIGQWCDEQEPLEAHPDLRLLAEFRQQDEYLLEPGDILYVPPRVAHWGIAEGDCTTFSIGFRAPRINEMLSRWTDAALERLDGELFYADAHSEPASRPGEIRRQDRSRISMQLQAAIDQIEDDSWFGELVTEPREAALQFGSDAQSLNALGGLGSSISLAPGARIAWQEDADAICLFANGQSTTTTRDYLPTIIDLCDTCVLPQATVTSLLESSPGRSLLAFLLNTGCLDADH